MSWYVIDIEADGPIPCDFSMIQIGAVKVEETLNPASFYGKLKPISNKWNPEALAVSGFTREETLQFEEPIKVIKDFDEWIKETNANGRPIFASDNNGFDWSFYNWYSHHFLGYNPFGWSSRRIGDLYCGMKMDVYTKWKHLRDTKHTHFPVDDAKGNMEALIKMKAMGLKVKF